jgi:hypothetical protein
MGRENYSQRGYGYTESEARKNAYESARDEYGHQEGYSGAMNCSDGSRDKVKCIKKPKIAKSCKVERVVQKGARKWETVFVVAPQWMRDDRGDTEVLKNSTQAKALKRAKVLALKNHIEYQVRIEKCLVSGNAKIATVEPKKSERGEWLFTGLAMC